MATFHKSGQQRINCTSRAAANPKFVRLSGPHVCLVLMVLTFPQQHQSFLMPFKFAVGDVPSHLASITPQAASPTTIGSQEGEAILE